MIVAVAVENQNTDTPVSFSFGRSPYFAFVDTDSGELRFVKNPFESAPSAAGIQAAQFVVNEGASALISSSVGPNSFDVLSAAGVAMYAAPQMTLTQAIDALKSGSLRPINTPGAAGHGQSTGAGRGMGMGRARGMGRGRRGAGGGAGHY